MKITEMDAKKNNPEKEIVSHLKKNGQKLNWLAKKMKVSQSHLFFVLKGGRTQKRPLTDENLIKINQALGTDFKK